jgi:hypothetical protein
VDWAREQFKERKSKSKRRRTVYVAIYVTDDPPKSRLLKSLVIKNATDEPEDRTEQDLRTARLVSEKSVKRDQASSPKPED